MRRLGADLYIELNGKSTLECDFKQFEQFVKQFAVDASHTNNNNKLVRFVARGATPTRGELIQLKWIRHSVNTNEPRSQVRICARFIGNLVGKFIKF